MLSHPAILARFLTLAPRQASRLNRDVNLKPLLAYARRNSWARRDSSTGFSVSALWYRPMPSSRHPHLAVVRQATPPESEALQQLRRGEITLGEYLDYQADLAVAHLKGLVDAVRLQSIRLMIREQMTNDPVLVEQLLRTTGLNLNAPLAL